MIFVINKDNSVCKRFGDERDSELVDEYGNERDGVHCWLNLCCKMTF